jgi:peptidoglycan/LPS O-acetylase OafA/YrhL
MGRSPASLAPPRAQISRVPYLPGLDGLRAVAVVAVMVYHANHEWLGGGFLGVEVFFVISGYLITLLLIGEHERSGRVELKQFWLRRSRRLLPALVVMLGSLAVYMALFNRRPQGQTRGDFVGGLFYGSNWYQIWVGQGYTAAEAFVPLRHLWSLAVEEQFYLIWPLVMVLVLRRGREHLPRVAMWLVGVSVTITVAMGLLYVPGDIPVTCSADDMTGYWRIAGRCINVNEALYLGTFSRAGGLMLGAAFAMVWRPLAIMRGPLRDKGRQLDLLAFAGLAGLAGLTWVLTLTGEGREFGQRFDPWLFRGGFFLVGLATLFVIAAATHRGAVTGRLLGNPLFNWVGTRSYGLYLYHWPIYQIIREFAGVGLTVGQFVLAMAITVPITEASYRFVETPIRKGAIGAWLHRDRHARTHEAATDRQRRVVVAATVAALVGFAGVSIATADNVCVGQQACDNQAALDALQSTSSSAPPESVPDTVSPVTQPGETTPPTEPTTSTTSTTIAPANLPPVAIGESVMLGALPNLQAGGITVDADVSRQGKQVAEIAQRMRANGQLGRTVIIQTGTNGSVSDETFAAIMSALPPADTPLVVVLTVKAPKGWIAGNNERIRNLPRLYPNVKVLDWEQRAAEISGELSRSDGGVHLSTDHAKQFYANLIFEAIGRPDLTR